mgnify:CR=1 FL=1
MTLMTSARCYAYYGFDKANGGRVTSWEQAASGRAERKKEQDSDEYVEFPFDVEAVWVDKQLTMELSDSSVMLVLYADPAPGGGEQDLCLRLPRPLQQSRGDDEDAVGGPEQVRRYMDLGYLDRRGGAARHPRSGTGELTARIEAPRVKSRKEPVPPAVYSEATEYGQEDS